ncbi:TonB-dependent receptor [Rurimicrobium arvi]|uniref:TonB-dependent receptor n=2 Tax=Rurimicrobium arvi TaxID=2049916 RepID=A0ABP8MZV2_9BACT
MAQLFKKQEKRAPNALDSVMVTHDFARVYLDSVYNYFHVRYGISIHYDTAYCSNLLFDYWYSATPLSLAIEITTREKDLEYTIDSTLTVTIKARHFHNVARRVDKSRIVPPDMAELNPYTLKGHVRDDSSGTPLADVQLQLSSTKDAVFTRDDGSFELSVVPADSTKLLVTARGYEPLELLLLPGISLRDFIIGLRPKENVLREAVITANRQDIMNLSGETVSSIRLSPSKLSEIPNVGDKDIMRTFQLMPGISAANESSSGLYVRGGTPDQNLVLLDGYTVYQVDHLYGFFSAFNANAIKDVQLFKGGFGAQYGGRLSSVTEMNGKEGSTKQFNIGGDISLLSMNMFTEIPVTEKLSVVAATRRSWRGPIYNWIFNSFNKGTGAQQQTSSGNRRGPGGSDNVTKAKSYFSDYNVRSTYRATTKDVLTYSFFSSTDDLDNGFSISAPAFLADQGISFDMSTTDLTHYSNLCMSGGWQRQWSGSFKGNTSLSMSEYSSDRNRETSGMIRRNGSDSTETKTGVFEHNRLQDISLHSDYEWSGIRHNRLLFGGFGTQYDISYTYAQSDTALLLDNHHKSLLAGVYLQDEYALWQRRLLLQGGIRASYFGATQQRYIEPRFSLIGKITGRLTFKAAYGKYYQFANRITREDLSTGSTQFWVLSDGQTVPVSSALHRIAGLSYETPKLLFSIEGYYKILDQLTQYTERYKASTALISYEQQFYKGNGFSEGIEFTAQKKTGKFTGWVSYTLGRTLNYFDVYGSGYIPADQDVRHEFKVVGMYKYKKWDFAATWIYASGRPYTAPGGSYDIALLDGTTQSYVTTTSKNTLRLPDYHRLDVAVNYHFYTDAGKDVGYIGLSLFNAYARENVWYKQFTVVDNAVVETNVNYLSFTPNLTLSLKIR